MHKQGFCGNMLCRQLMPDTANVLHIACIVCYNGVSKSRLGSERGTCSARPAVLQLHELHACTNSVALVHE